jgi:hypothetical protein
VKVLGVSSSQRKKQVFVNRKWTFRYTKLLLKHDSGVSQMGVCLWNRYKWIRLRYGLVILAE